MGRSLVQPEGEGVRLAVRRELTSTGLERARARAPVEDTLRRASVPSRSVTRRVVYAGDGRFEVQGTEFVPWNAIDRVAWG